MTVDYRDILEAVDRIYSNNYPAQTGALRAILTSVLVSVKVRDPDMFQEIVESEMQIQERMEALFKPTQKETEND